MTPDSRSFDSLKIYEDILGKKFFIEPDLEWIFFYRDQQNKTHLYALKITDGDLDLTQAMKISNYNFGLNQSTIVQYESESQTLFLLMDRDNNELTNIYALKLNLDQLDELAEPQPLTQMNNVKLIKVFSEHIYFINRVAISGATFKNEIYRINRNTKELQLLLSDESWIHKLGWGGAKLSDDEKQMVLCLDEKSERKNINFAVLNVPSSTEFSKAITEEPKGLLTDSYLNQQNYFMHLSSKGVYFHSQITGYENIFFYDFQKQTVRQLTFLNQPECFVDIRKANGQFAIITLTPDKKKIQTQIQLATIEDVEKNNTFEFKTISKKGLYTTSMFHRTWSFIRSEYDCPARHEVIDENLQTFASFSTFTPQTIDYDYKYLEYVSFDGLVIPGYLITPKDHKKIKGGLVESFYGGTSRFRPDFFNYLKAGFAIFSPGVRGSWGYGQEWENRLLGDLGGKEILDVHAAAICLSSELPQIKNKIGIFGGSHGGYAVLRALTLPPEFLPDAPRFDFSFGICECGFADLEAFYKDSRIADWLKYFMGELDANRDLYRERSPIHYVHHLKASLLLIHGLNDTRVPFSTIRSFIEKIKDDSKVKHEIVIHPNGGHHQNTTTELQNEMKRQLNFLISTLNVA